MIPPQNQCFRLFFSVVLFAPAGYARGDVICGPSRRIWSAGTSTMSLFWCTNIS